MYHRILHHQPVPALRRERVTPDPALLLKSPIAEGAVEIHLFPDGRIEWLLSAPSPQALSVFGSAVERTFPGAGVCPDLVPCALPGHPAEHWTFAWAKQRMRHWNPLDITKDHDYADSLITALSSPIARGHEVVVQTLFRATGDWEENLHLFTSPREKLLLYHQGFDVSMTGSYTKRTPTQWDQEQHRTLSQRLREPPFHVEFRAAAYGPEAKTVLAYCVEDSYLKQILSGKWRTLRFVKDKKKLEFDHAYRAHSFDTFVNGRERRNMARNEFAPLLCPPSSRPHAALQYYVEDQEITALRELRAKTNSSANPAPARSIKERFDEIAGRTSQPPTTLVAPPAPQAPLPKFLPTSGPEATLRWVEMGKNFQGDSVFLSENPPWNHAAVLGATGFGKSTLLIQWALETLLKKPTWTVVLIDPHGTLAEALKALLPPDIAADTIELDPSQLTFNENGTEMVSLPLNILALPDMKTMDAAAFSKAREIIVDNLVYFVKAIWGSENFGTQMDHNISSLATGLLEIPGTNLVDMYYVMTNPQARVRLAELVKSEGVRRFILDELPRLSNVRYSQDRISSTLNRLGKITNNPLLRQTLCQRVNPVDFKTLLDHRLVIVNISKTKIGDEASRFLGAMCFARLWLAVLQRGVTGKQTCLFVDEFQDFVTPSIAHVLAEARKFGLHLVMANQYLEQIPDAIRSAVIANTKTWVFFQMGVEDSRRAADISRLGRRGWTEETLRSMPRYRAIFVQDNRLEMLNTYPPPKPNEDPAAVNDMVRASTRRYASEETSAASPFLVDDKQCLAVLDAIKDGPKTYQELKLEVPFHWSEVMEAVLRCHQLGYLDFDRAKKTNTITELGRRHLDNGGYRGGGGVGHEQLVAEAKTYLKSQGFDMPSEPPQGPGISAADLYHYEGGVLIHDEIETTGKNHKQVVDNLEKAGGAPVYFFVPTFLVASLVFDALAGRMGFSVFVRTEVNLFTRVSQESPSDDVPTMGSASDDSSMQEGKVDSSESSRCDETTVVKEDGSAPASPAGSTEPAIAATAENQLRERKPSGQAYMRQEVLDFCNKLKLLGKVEENDGKPAVLLCDLCVFYNGWNETMLGMQLKLLGFETDRIRLPGHKEKQTVCFPWAA